LLKLQSNDSELNYAFDKIVNRYVAENKLNLLPNSIKLDDKFLRQKELKALENEMKSSPFGHTKEGVESYIDDNCLEAVMERL
jgi:predicted metal-dependent peptidase